MNTSSIIANNLLEMKAVSLRPNEPYTWASGIKSPIYCDNRLALSFPAHRSTVVKAFVALIQKEYPEAQVLMGTATAGISWAAMCAQEMDLPMGYVRSSNKDHGKGNKIEGKLKKGDKVVIVEDLISTGGSVQGVVEALREAGAEVLGVVAIFTYLLPQAAKTFADLNCPYATLSDYDTLIQTALARNEIRQSDLDKLNAWKQDPNDEAWMNR
ncbi:MAG: orotate phosphoribosyltransferase [Erysipelotrichaceae bacterium]|nr:orotate phosphoribosyltransferase [Erysipelotrichaceae bacterium]